MVLFWRISELYLAYEVHDYDLIGRHLSESPDYAMLLVDMTPKHSPHSTINFVHMI